MTVFRPTRHALPATALCALPLLWTATAAAQDAPEAEPPADAIPEETPEAAPAPEATAEADAAATAEAEVTEPAATAEMPAPEAAPPAPPPEAAPPPPAAALPIGLIVTADMWTRYEIRDGYAELGASNARWREGDATFYRARLGLKTTPLEIAEGTTASIQFTPQATGVVPTPQIVDRPLDFHEGYIRIAGDKYNVDVGRFEMVYGDHLVIGNLGWHQTARAFDGARAQFRLGDSGAFVDAFFTQTSEGYPEDPKPLLNGDSYFAGIYAGLGPALAEKLALDVYLLSRIWGQNDTAPADPTDPASLPSTADAAAELTLGARIVHRVSLLDYRAEGGLQFGQRQSGLRLQGDAAPVNQDVLAAQIDGSVGVNFVEDTVRIGVGGAVASGNDPASTDKDEGWNQLFPTAHKFFGLMDLFGLGHTRDGVGRTNVASANASIKVATLKPMVLLVDGHLFHRFFTAAVDANGDSANFAGGEVDTNLIWNIGKATKLRALYGFFVPNGDHYGSDRIANYFALQFGHVL